jgi:hypothetical protein
MRSQPCKGGDMACVRGPYGAHSLTVQHDIINEKRPNLSPRFGLFYSIFQLHSNLAK